MAIRFPFVRRTFRGLLVATGALLVPSALHASGLPDGWTLEIKAEIILDKTYWEDKGKGRRVTERASSDWSRHFRVFALRDRLIVSRPDFTYDVTVDNKPAKKDAIGAPAGRWHCVKVRAAGDIEDMCATYRAEPNGVALRLRRDAIAGPWKGRTEEAYRLTVSPPSCQVELIAVSGDLTRMLHAVVGTTTGYAQTGRLASGSCRLIKGREAF